MWVGTFRSPSWPSRSHSAHSLAHSAAATAWPGSWSVEPAAPVARSSQCTNQGTSRDDFQNRTSAPKCGEHLPENWIYHGLCTRIQLAYHQISVKPVMFVGHWTPILNTWTGKQMDAAWTNCWGDLSSPLIHGGFQKCGDTTASSICIGFFVINHPT